MLSRLTLPFVLAAALGIAVAPAYAQRCEAPPGTAAVDQYCESIPDERGATQSSRYAETPDAGPGQTPLGRRLESQGPGGVELAAFVERTRPTGAVRGASAEGPGLAAPPEDALAVVRSSAAAGPVTGTAFLIALITIAALVAGLWAIERRRPSNDG